MPSHSIVQSVLLRRSAFKTLDEAKKWITEHGYKYALPDVTPTYYRFRQHAPEPLALTHRLRTTQLGEPERNSPMGSVGALIIAYPKDTAPLAPKPAAAGAGEPESRRTIVMKALDEMIAHAGEYAEWSEPAAKTAKVGKMKVKRDEVKYVVEEDGDYSYKRIKAMIVTIRLPEKVEPEVIVNRHDPRPPFPEISVTGKKLEVVVIDKGYMYLKGELEEAKRLWKARG
jgi:hypothetical protein